MNSKIQKALLIPKGWPFTPLENEKVDNDILEKFIDHLKNTNGLNWQDRIDKAYKTFKL